MMKCPCDSLLKVDRDVDGTLITVPCPNCGEQWYMPPGYDHYIGHKAFHRMVDDMRGEA